MDQCLLLLVARAGDRRINVKDDWIGEYARSQKGHPIPGKELALNEAIIETQDQAASDGTDIGGRGNHWT
jgi:hypothetical protein